MPKTDEEKMKLLDEDVLQTEQLKDLIISELSRMTEGLHEKVKNLGVLDPKKFQSSLESLKSFLESSTNIMTNLDDQIKEIIRNITKTKTMLDQIGYMM
ncbi:MAG: hypothetical protein ACTSRZ_18615 [Promethearchaeota archaeon]